MYLNMVYRHFDPPCLPPVLCMHICVDAAGVHDVKMVGLKCDVDVMCVPIEEGVFGCTYVPEVAGKFIHVYHECWRKLVLQSSEK